MVLTQVKIDAVDVTSYLVNYEYERVFGDAISQADLTFVRGIGSVITIDTGLRVEIWRGFTTATDEKIFDGYVESFSPETGIVRFVAKDKMWDLVRKEVNKTYDSTLDASAGKISEIFLDLVTTYGELTADSTTVQDSGTTIIIDKFPCKRTDILERCKQLAKILDWQFYYRADTDKVYFEPKGYTTNSTTLTVGSNVYGLPRWNYDNTEMVNNLTVRGAYQELDTSETGRIGTTSGYTTTGVTLTQVPIAVKVYADAVNPPTTLKTGGVPDSTSDFYYYVDKNQQKIYPKEGTTFVNNDYFKIDYSYSQPIPINQYNQVSIDAYGEFQKTIDLIDLRSVADAEVRATKYLEIYSQPFVYTTLRVKLDSSIALKVGDRVQVVDTISPKTVNRLLVINRLRLRYPGDFIEVDVGDKQWRIAEWQSSVEERLKRLQEDNQESAEILVQIITADNLTGSPISINPRYRKVLTQTITDNTILVWDHPSQGTWDNFVWGGEALGAETDHFIQQHENTYSESFVDTDFKDTGTTTATWTTVGSCAFTAGQTARSSSIDYNNSTITTATATFTGSGAGTPTYYMSANGGSNWETVTSGVAKTFSNTGTDLRWRVDVAGGNYSITAVTITDYH